MRTAVPFARLAGMSASALLLVWSPLGAAVDASTLATLGKAHGVASCASCHGADGAGQVAAGFPRLAGLNGAYLRKQLDDFASGARENAVMRPIATALDADERKAISDYYAKLPIPAALAKPAAENPKDDSPGALLATGLAHHQLGRQLDVDRLLRADVRSGADGMPEGVVCATKRTRRRDERHQQFRRALAHLLKRLLHRRQRGTQVR